MEENPYKAPPESNQAAQKRRAEPPRKSIAITTGCICIGGAAVEFGLNHPARLQLLGGLIAGGLVGLVIAFVFCDDWRSA